ncbi:MAG: hypothetical protein KME46_06180 [Brasilonema angustatum HA4187-MV1]|nr:hypothetical protein [Brasilonema angustatum HA4187-MV1]
MNTVNGKLINQEQSQLEELTQKTETIIRRCEFLESQVTDLSRQDYIQYLQKVNQEVNSAKFYLQNLDKRIGFFEEMTSKQTKQLLFIKISSVVGLVGLSFMFSTNHLPEYNNHQSQQHTESTELDFASSQQHYIRDKKH